jgi:hypothetical protein
MKVDASAAQMYIEPIPPLILPFAGPVAPGDRVLDCFRAARLLLNPLRPFCVDAE